MSGRIARLVAVLALLGAGVSWAHDMWIEPSGFEPGQGTRLAVRLRIGQQFQGDPFPRDPALLLRFAVIGPGGGANAVEAPIQGVPGTDPAGYLVTGGPGLYELVYASRHAAVELDAARVEKYLADQGLEATRAPPARPRQGPAGGEEARPPFGQHAL